MQQHINIFKKIRLISLLVISLLLVFITLSSPLTALAADKTGLDACAKYNTGSKICDEFQDGGAKATSMIGKITNSMLLLAGAIAVGAIIYSAIQYIVASGDKSKIETAKKSLSYSITGLVIVIIAYAVVQYIIIKMSS